MSEQVDILLATFQGAEYLEEQLESILTQTHPQIQLLIRDDRSSDQTLSILLKWAHTYPQKITLLHSTERLGIKGNFSQLMKQSSSPYLMFADQDDKWLPCKVEMSLNQMKSMERQFGSHLPLLVHTDLTVTDQNLKEISHSFCHYAGLNPIQTPLNRLLSQNSITGCTMLMNRALIELALPVPAEAIMHDWWMALVAACFGQIQYVNQPTLFYRQHCSNDTGAKRYGFWSWFNQTRMDLDKKKHSMNQTYRQASCLLERYGQNLSSTNLTLIQAYRDLEKLSYFNKKYQTIKYGFFKQGFLRNAKMLLTR